MSEQELDAILKEIRSRGKSDSVDNNTDTEVPDFDTPKENEVKEAVDNFLVSTNDEKSEDFSLTSTEINSDSNEPEPKPKKKKNNKKAIIITIVAIVLVIAIGVGVYFGFFHKKNTDTPTSPSTTESSVTNSVANDNAIRNPLTGETGYDESALTQRPVAVVVENEYSTESVRPQWALSDADIVLEGESEYSTRLLLFWADYNKVPAQVGPTRSARPPFIRFSQLFDSVFIHAGLSKSKGDYVGADTVFTSENVDHINLLQLSSDSTYFSRDKSRTSTIEHTGYLNGTNLAKLLEQKNIDTTLNEAKFTSLNFNSEAQALSTENASTVKFTWSSSSAGGRCPKVGTFTYDESTHKYTTTDFDSKYGESGVQDRKSVV